MRQFIMLPEFDQEGKPMGYTYLNRAHIIYGTFDAVRCIFTVAISEPNTKTGLSQVDLLNKDGKVTGAKGQGVVSVTTIRHFSYTGRREILDLHNFINEIPGYVYNTEKDFEGFKLHDEIKAEVEEFKKEKQREEEEKLLKDDFEAENRHRAQAQMPQFTWKEFKTLRAAQNATNDTHIPETLNSTENGRETTQSESRPLTAVKGGQSEQGPTEGGDTYKEGVDPHYRESAPAGEAKILTSEELQQQRAGEHIQLITKHSHGLDRGKGATDTGHPGAKQAFPITEEAEGTIEDFEAAVPKSQQTEGQRQIEAENSQNEKVDPS